MQHSVLQKKTHCDSTKPTVYIASKHSRESLISSSDEEHFDLLLGQKQGDGGFIVSILHAGERDKLRIFLRIFLRLFVDIYCCIALILAGSV